MMYCSQHKQMYWIGLSLKYSQIFVQLCQQWSRCHPKHSAKSQSVISKCSQSKIKMLHYKAVHCKRLIQNMLAGSDCVLMIPNYMLHTPSVSLPLSPTLERSIARARMRTVNDNRWQDYTWRHHIFLTLKLWTLTWHAKHTCEIQAWTDERLLGTQILKCFKDFISQVKRQSWTCASCNL